ncbi:b127 [Murid betaherpesvirus 8]|uniref:B127 n=3 Tax=Muromegalovirus TaxID=10365 RepID=K7XY37_RCMVE|nr:e127 [Murid betaherpesvirus 8]AAO45420.1 vOX-2 [Murid betaherpesvirus 2]AKE44285.1 a127 [Rat cytomegalovirus ALL-03]AFX83435.1 e127 [Murid betaherpesvirus 8]AKB93314.1 b127 [Murid betaherpesvirus 8]WEG71907.1 membrane protein m127.2 [Murid betaherpesvirus 8]
MNLMFILFYIIISINPTLSQVEVVTQDVNSSLRSPASLRCSLKTTQEPLIVTWQKKKAVGPENMATYSKAHGVVLQPTYKDRINITELGLLNSSITFWNATLDDEGCYMCLFNMFGSGKVSGTSCLTLRYTPSVFISGNLSDNILNVTCSAVSRPNVSITWVPLGDGLKNFTTSQSQSDGTTKVTSVLYGNLTLHNKNVTCRIIYLNTVYNYSVVLDGFYPTPPTSPVSFTSDNSTRTTRTILLLIIIFMILTTVIALLYWRKQRYSRLMRFYRRSVVPLCPKL